MSAKIASVLVVVVAVSGCSGKSTSHRRGGGEAQAGEAGEPGTGGSANRGGSSGAGGSAGTGISAGSGGSSCNVEEEPWIALDASDCAERAEGDCTGLACEYSSNPRFEGAPALVDCGQYVSLDGCGRLVFEFDENGCAVSVGPHPEAWDVDEHLGALRACMTEVFAGGRFACLASGTLAFYESCFIE